MVNERDREREREDKTEERERTRRMRDGGKSGSEKKLGLEMEFGLEK